MPHVRTNDGVELYYRDWGTGRPVVFLHSMLMSSAMWDYQMLHVVDNGHRAVAYDRRGHGRSDDPSAGYDFDTLADDLASVLETLDLSNATLVGHSMGGGGVIRYLTRHSDGRVSRIVLVGSTVPHLEVTTDARTALLTNLRTGYGRWVTDNAELSFGDQPGPREIPQLEKEQAIRDWMGVSLQAALRCTENNLAADFRAELRTVSVPALIIHGDHDTFAPLELCGRQSAELIDRSSLLVYQHAAHMLHLTHREQLNADLLVNDEDPYPAGDRPVPARVDPAACCVERVRQARARETEPVINSKSRQWTRAPSCARPDRVATTPPAPTGSALAPKTRFNGVATRSAYDAFEPHATGGSCLLRTRAKYFGL